MKWLWRFGAVLVTLFILQSFVISTFIVENESMFPTYLDGDAVVVSKLSSIERGDVVVVDAQPAFFTQRDIEFVIKRVIAVGGDRVVCCNSDGQLVLNGSTLREPYVNNEASDIRFDITVPEDALWLMGDNRKKSLDSRDLLGLPGGGAISLKHIIGEVVWVLWRS